MKRASVVSRIMTGSGLMLICVAAAGDENNAFLKISRVKLKSTKRAERLFARTFLYQAGCNKDVGIRVRKEMKIPEKHAFIMPEYARV